MSGKKTSKERGEALSGKGYGTQRYKLLQSARRRIEDSIEGGYSCEAIAIVESVITDRLESRLSHLSKTNHGFESLGGLLRQLTGFETDPQLREIMLELDRWRVRRNEAIHELVKVEAGKPKIAWDERMANVARTARDGYELLKQLYHRVADVHPNHPDRVFPQPASETAP